MRNTYTCPGNQGQPLWRVSAPENDLAAAALIAALKCGADAREHYEVKYYYDFLSPKGKQALASQYYAGSSAMGKEGICPSATGKEIEAVQAKRFRDKFLRAMHDCPMAKYPDGAILDRRSVVERLRADGYVVGSGQ